MRKRPKVHDRGAPHRCTPDLGKVQEIISVSQVKASHLMAKALQMAGHRPTDVAAMPGDENAHATMIPLVPEGRPPICLAVSLGQSRARHTDQVRKVARDLDPHTNCEMIRSGRRLTIEATVGL